MHTFGTLLQAKRPLLILAPLASLSHRGLREMIARHGACDLYFSEMISADALLAGSPYECHYLDRGPQPSRLVYQLVGADTDNLVKASEKLLQVIARDQEHGGEAGAAGIDLNMGCSAPEMVRQGAGVHWMSQPEAARRLVARVRERVGPELSLSAKIRIGEELDFPALVRLCAGLQEEGLDFITLHPRLRKDPWSRPARWNWFADLARELRIPLVANGDIQGPTSLAELAEAWRRPGEPEDWPCGLMVGRAAVRKPWVFRRLAAALEAWPAAPAPTGKIDLMDAAREFHQALEAWQPKDFWFTRAKRFYAFFAQNLVYGNRVAANIQNLASYGLIQPFFERYLEEHPEERFVD